MKSPKLRGCFTLFLLLLLHSETSTATENNKNEIIETIQCKLPRVAVPISYDIKFDPQIMENNFTFCGESKTLIMVNETTTNLTLHSENLRINETFTLLVGIDGSQLKPTNHMYDNISDFLVIAFEKPINPGNYTLHLKFSGNMSNVPEGIFNSSYTRENGEKVWLVATKFTQINARRAFPCWDEEDLKATFNLSVKHANNYTVVSNMPVLSKTPDGSDKHWTTFETTPRMSTYLLAFVVSDFECFTDDNKNFSICGRKDILPQLKHSRDVSQRALKLLENYFDDKYSLPKIDHYAVPDATTGATENWGLIIYRESSLTYDPLVNPISGKEYVTLTIIHELAHQWIGNLVTPVTCKYSWIKEGLPTYLQYQIVDKLFPKWKETDTFVTRIIQETAFNYDNTDFYKALEWDPENAANIKIKFSPQIYNRGAAIFHMMSNMLTEPVFHDGVIKFVKENEFASITSDHLWNAMQSALHDSKKTLPNEASLKEIMKEWVEQQGYPILNVTRDYETGKVTITQEGNLKEHKSNRWWIPINFATKSNLSFCYTSPTHWLKPGDASLVIEGIPNDDWIIINYEQSGYYRVNYDTKNWKLIGEWMNAPEYFEQIPVRTRSQLINDLSYMVTVNREQYTTLLDLTRYLVREDNYQPWIPTFHAIKRLRRTILDEATDEKLKKYIVNLMDHITKDVIAKTKTLLRSRGSEDDTDEDFLAKRYGAKFLSFACLLGNKECKELANAEMKSSIENTMKNQISPDFVGWVNCHGSETYEKELLRNINGSDVKYVAFLGCSPNKTILTDFVEKIIAGQTNATAKQARTAIGFLGEDGTKNFDNALNYVITNFDRIWKYFENNEKSGGEKIMGDKTTGQCTNEAVSIFISYINRVRTPEQCEKIRNFLTKESSRFPPTINESVDERLNIINKASEYDQILSKWLDDQSLKKE